MPPDFEILEHVADIGFLARGRNLAELFETSARAMMAIAADTSAVEVRQERHVELQAADVESLLVDWLSEVLYLFDSDELVIARYNLESVTAERLTATLKGEPREPARHPWELIVKAVTYHELEVRERDGLWQARVILDV